MMDAPPTTPRVLVMLGGIPLHGQERGNIQVFAALKDHGVESLFVTHREYGHESIQPMLDRLGLDWTVGTYPGLLSRGMGVRRWAARLREIVLANWDFWRAGRRFRPTHIHVCNEGHLLALLPAVRALGVPVVYRLGDEPRQHRPMFRAIWRRLLIPAVTEFVCISDFIRERLLAAGAPTEAVRVIRSAPPERPAGGLGDALGGSSGASGGEGALAAVAAEPFAGRTVVYMGQISEHKGVGVLIDAARELLRERDDVRFLIAGDYTWENPFAEALIESVEADGLDGRIRFLGYVDDVPALLALADVHCAPSVWEEPLGNVVLEAKRAGVPSVVFPSGGLPEMIAAPGTDGLVCARKDASALAAGLRSFLDRSDEDRVAVRRAATSSLRTLGATTDQFVSAWGRVYSGGAMSAASRVPEASAVFNR